jgi:hypothetical protein
MNSQDLLADGNNFKSTTGFTTGTVCTRTGSYKASNKYMQAIVVVVKGDKFPTFTDGRKTTWYALSSSTSTTSSGFDSITVEAGTV